MSKQVQVDQASNQDIFDRVKNYMNTQRSETLLLLAWSNGFPHETGQVVMTSLDLNGFKIQTKHGSSKLIGFYPPLKDSNQLRQRLMDIHFRALLGLCPKTTASMLSFLFLVSLLFAFSSIDHSLISIQREFFL